MESNLTYNTELTANLEDLVTELSFIGWIESYKLNLEINQPPESSSYIAMSLPKNMACISKNFSISSEDWINTLYEIRVDRLDSTGISSQQAIMLPTNSDIEQAEFGNRRIKREFVLFCLRNNHTADTLRIFISTWIRLINKEILDREIIPSFGLKYNNQALRVYGQDLASQDNTQNILQPTSVQQFRMFNAYPLKPVQADPGWTHKKYRCATCNSIAEVDLDSSGNVKIREFRDQNIIEPDTRAFWGHGAHNRCPLLLPANLASYTQAILDGEVIEL